MMAPKLFRQRLALGEGAALRGRAEPARARRTQVRQAERQRQIRTLRRGGPFCIRLGPFAAGGPLCPAKSHRAEVRAAGRLVFHLLQLVEQTSLPSPSLAGPPEGSIGVKLWKVTSEPD